MPGQQLCYAHRQRAEPFRPAPRPPPLMGRLLSRASPAQKAPLLGVTPRCAGRCRGATEGSGPVYVGKERLVGEVIRLTNDITTIQVFEETTGLRPGDPVEATGDAISVTLGPGILNNIFDGIERPLSEIAKSSGKYISRGVSVDSLDTEKKWQTHITVKPGEFVSGGTIIAEVQETQAIVHKSMVPPNISGTVLEVAMDGEYTINEPIVTVQLANGKEEKLTLAQKWPIRVPRPTAARFAASKPLITGQRILDTLFPIAKGWGYHSETAPSG